MENQINTTHKAHNTKTILGVILIGLGVLLLFGHTAFFFFPHFIFSWPVMMIAVGLYIGAKHNFQKSNWIILTAIGVVFLLPNIIPSFTLGLLWPLLIMALGVTIYTRSKQHWNGENWEKRNDDKFKKFDNNI